MLRGLIILSLLIAALNSGAIRGVIQGESDADTPVLVAKSLILKGTSGAKIAKRDQYQAAELPRDVIKEGAIADPAYLNGRVAVNDILPGQQLTVTDFTPR